MNRRRVVFFLASCVTVAAQTNPAYYRMKRAQVIDQYGFERPMPAMTLLIPTDWQFQGGVQYQKGNLCSLQQTTFRATGPDGRSIELFPDSNWQWSDDPQTVQYLRIDLQQKAQFGTKGCDLAPPLNAADYLRRISVPRVRPNGRLIAVEPMPKIAQQMENVARQAEASAAQAGLRMMIRSDVARARVQSTVNGRAVEEWITAVILTRATPSPTFNIQTGRQGQANFYNSWAQTFDLAAPQGQLDASEKFFEMVTSTIRIDPNWQNRINGVQNNIAAAQIKGAADRSAIITKSNAEISNIITQGYNDRQKVMDRTSENFSQAIRGVETYRNPSTGETIDLSNQYGHAWVNNQGEYLLSDQEGFNPNVTLKNWNWTALEHVKK